MCQDNKQPGLMERILLTLDMLQGIMNIQLPMQLQSRYNIYIMNSIAFVFTAVSLVIATRDFRYWGFLIFTFLFWYLAFDVKFDFWDSPIVECEVKCLAIEPIARRSTVKVVCGWEEEEIALKFMLTPEKAIDFIPDKRYRILFAMCKEDILLGYSQIEM